MHNFRCAHWHGHRILLAAVGPALLSGCTTLVATTSIEPYTKQKDRRAVLERLAENYCEQKRGLGSERPDYIFTTDGCSRWPDGGYVTCCIVHDIAYWCGGSADDRREADESLRSCLSEKTAALGYLVYSGVRVGGMPWLPTPWRWGYGWDVWPKGYEALEHSPSVRTILESLNARSIVEGHLHEGGKMLQVQDGGVR